MRSPDPQGSSQSTESPCAVGAGTRPPALIESGIRAVIFDLDGVITHTATLHFAAWKALFDDFLRHRGTAGEFTETDYVTFVDGKPRYEGVDSFLRSRGIALPWGDPAEPPGDGTVCGLGNRKNRLFNEMLRSHGVTVFDSSVTLVEDLRAHGIRAAVVSSSKNCRFILESAGLIGLFEVVIDGIYAAEHGLPGKPAPDTFLRAAELMGLRPDECAVVEDAVVGVQAGEAGAFRLVIGIDRGAGHQALAAGGADIVVDDLGELDVTEAAEPKLRPVAEIPSALERFDLLRQCLGGRRPAVFLDYDGTLTPIVDRPELAVLSEAARRGVDALARKVTVAVISGRDRADVERLVGIDSLVFAGSHGFDIRLPDGGELGQGGDFAPLLDAVERRLHEALDPLPGALVERKKFSIAAHYRLVAPERAHLVGDTVSAILADTPEIKMTPGKMVFELQPRLDWDKGKAVLWLMQSLGLRADGVVPMFFGDDVTDEHAFAALRDIGIGVIAARADKARSTGARFRVDDPEQVRQLLERLAQLY